MEQTTEVKVIIDSHVDEHMLDLLRKGHKIEMLGYNSIGNLKNT